MLALGLLAMWQELQVCGLAEPTRNPFRVASQGQRGRRNNVKCFADAPTSICHGTEERLRDIISVNVMKCLHSKIRQGHFLTARKSREDVGIQIAGGIDWNPARSDNMAGL